MPELTIEIIDYRITVALSNLRTLLRRATRAVAVAHLAGDTDKEQDLYFEVELLKGKIHLLELYVNSDS